MTLTAATTAATRSSSRPSAARVLSGPLLSVTVGLLDPHPDNVRRHLGDLTELAASIRACGLLQPLLVEPQPGAGRRFRVLAGHRRLAAAKLAGRDTVPCLIRPEEFLDNQLPLMLVENLQRTELTPIEEAGACAQLTDMGLDQPEIARRVGKSVAWVAGRLALLALPQDARQLVETRRITIAGAVQLGRQVRRAGVGEVSAEPRCRGHFTSTHPLAPAARVRCDASTHPTRGRVGSVACGACWEQAIRDSAEATR